MHSVQHAINSGCMQVKARERERERARPGIEREAVYSVQYDSILQRLQLTTKHQAGNAYMSEKTNVLYKMRSKTAHEIMLFTLKSTFRCSIVLMFVAKAYYKLRRRRSAHLDWGNPWVWVSWAIVTPEERDSHLGLPLLYRCC